MTSEELHRRQLDFLAAMFLAGLVSAEAYEEIVRDLKLAFAGPAGSLASRLEKRLRRLA